MKQFSLCRVCGCWDSRLLHAKLVGTKSLSYHGCVMSQTTQNKVLRKGVGFNSCLSCLYAQHIKNLKFSNFRNKSYKIWKKIESRKIKIYTAFRRTTDASSSVYSILKHQSVTHCVHRLDSKNKWVKKLAAMPATSRLAGIALSIRVQSHMASIECKFYKDNLYDVSILLRSY